MDKIEFFPPVMTQRIAYSLGQSQEILRFDQQDPVRALKCRPADQLWNTAVLAC
jgi:hypothetical protein